MISDLTITHSAMGLKIRVNRDVVELTPTQVQELISYLNNIQVTPTHLTGSWRQWS